MEKFVHTISANWRYSKQKSNRDEILTWKIDFTSYKSKIALPFNLWLGATSVETMHRLLLLIICFSFSHLFIFCGKLNKSRHHKVKYNRMGITLLETLQGTLVPSVAPLFPCTPHLHSYLMHVSFTWNDVWTIQQWIWISVGTSYSNFIQHNVYECPWACRGLSGCIL